MMKEPDVLGLTNLGHNIQHIHGFITYVDSYDDLLRMSSGGIVEMIQDLLIKHQGC